jgi:hypothetical protein
LKDVIYWELTPRKYVGHYTPTIHLQEKIVC